MPRNSFQTTRRTASSSGAFLGILFDEVRDDFGVGFGDELMALALQLLFSVSR